MRQIIHLHGSDSDYTLCGFGQERVSKNGEILDEDNAGLIAEDTTERYMSYRALVIKKRWNTNCRLCQAAVANVLGQIKRRIRV